MRFLVIPVAHGLPAVQAHFERYPDNEVPPSVEELRELVKLACRFVPVSEALVTYATALAGRPQPD